MESRNSIEKKLLVTRVLAKLLSWLSTKYGEITHVHKIELSLP